MTRSNEVRKTRGRPTTSNQEVEPDMPILTHRTRRVGRTPTAMSDIDGELDQDLDVSLKYPRTGKRGAPQAFPRKLFEILCKEPNDTIGWTPNGASFLIRDMERFSMHILMKYFRHQKYSSFQRQLNLYGFRKVSKGFDVGAYAHKYFLAGRDDLLHNVRRMPQATVSSSSASKASSEYYARLMTSDDEGEDLVPHITSKLTHVDSEKSNDTWASTDSEPTSGEGLNLSEETKSDTVDSKKMPSSKESKKKDKSMSHTKKDANQTPASGKQGKNKSNNSGSSSKSASTLNMLKEEKKASKNKKAGEKATKKKKAIDVASGLSDVGSKPEKLTKVSRKAAVKDNNQADSFDYASVFTVGDLAGIDSSSLDSNNMGLLPFPLDAASLDYADASSSCQSTNFNYWIEPSTSSIKRVESVVMSELERNVKQESSSPEDYNDLLATSCCQCTNKGRDGDSCNGEKSGESLKRRLGSCFSGMLDDTMALDEDRSLPEECDFCIIKNQALKDKVMVAQPTSFEAGSSIITQEPGKAFKHSQQELPTASVLPHGLTSVVPLPAVSTAVSNNAGTIPLIHQPQPQRGSASASTATSPSTSRGVSPIDTWTFLQGESLAGSMMEMNEAKEEACDKTTCVLNQLDKLQVKCDYLHKTDPDASRSECAATNKLATNQKQTQRPNGQYQVNINHSQVMDYDNEPTTPSCIIYPPSSFALAKSVSTSDLLRPQLLCSNSDNFYDDWLLDSSHESINLASGDGNTLDCTSSIAFTYPLPLSTASQI